MVFKNKTHFIANVSAIPAGVDSVLVENVNQPPAGAFVAALTYTRSATSAGLFGEVPDATNGIIWVPKYTRDVVNCCEFGACGDGSVNGFGVVTGTPNQSAIQAAIDFALQNHIPDVRLPYGTYATADTIHLGWGNDFTTVRLYGAGRAAFGATAGTTLLPTCVDRPVINIQGGRRSGVFGLQIIGQNAAPELVLAKNNDWAPEPDRWLSGALIPKSASDPGGIQRYAPYCAIAVDAYSRQNGPAAAQSYPAVTYPTWAAFAFGSPRPSSESTIAECSISRFGVGIITQPAADANGDFTRIRDCAIESCVFGIAICQPQSRNVEIRNVDYRYCHTVVTGTRFGKGGGELGGPICNVSGGASYQLAEFETLGLAASLHFQNVYCENQVRIGTFVGSTGVSCAVTFESCYFNLAESTSNNGHRQFPSGFIVAGHQHTIILRGTTVIGSPSRLSNLIAEKSVQQGTPAIVVEGCSLWAGQGMTGAGARQAVNYCGGVLLGAARHNSLGRNLVTFVGDNNIGTFFPPSGAAQEFRAFGEDLDFRGQERIPLHHAAKTFIDRNERCWRVSTSVMQSIIDIHTVGPGSHVVSAATSIHDVWTFTYSHTMNTQAPRRYHIDVGDLLYNQDTGTILLVTAVVQVTAAGDVQVRCEQQNNMRWDANGQFVSTVSTLLQGQPILAGSTLLLKTGVVVSRTVYWGDFTVGSASVSNVHRGDGLGNDVLTSLSTSDLFLGSWFADPGEAWCLPRNTTIVALVPGNPAQVQLSTAATLSGRSPIYPLPIH